MIVKNVSSRIHHLSDAGGKPLALLPGQSVDLPEAMHARIMACPSGLAGELVGWDQPMPSPAAMSLGALDDDKAIVAITTCKDTEILAQWLKRESRPQIRQAISSRMKGLVAPEPIELPPPPDAPAWSAPEPVELPPPPDAPAWSAPAKSKR
jgi:hypothetical protein